MRVRRIQTIVASCLALAALCSTVLIAAPVMANPGGDNISSAVPESLPLSVTGSLDSTSTDVRDVYAITLTEGETIEATLTGPADADFDLFLYRPGTTSIDETKTPRATWSDGPTANEHFTFMAADAGTYYVDVAAWSGAGAYSLDVQKIDAVKFKLSGFTVPKSAKKGKKVKVSVTVTPGYNGQYTPIEFGFFRYEKGKYKLKTVVGGGGVRSPGAAHSVFTASYKFPKKGKWEVGVMFWDEAHTNGGITMKKITIK